MSREIVFTLVPEADSKICRRPRPGSDTCAALALAITLTQDRLLLVYQFSTGMIAEHTVDPTPRLTSQLDHEVARAGHGAGLLSMLMGHEVTNSDRGKTSMYVRPEEPKDGTDRVRSR